MSFFSPPMRSISACCSFSRMSYSRDFRTFIAESRFLCCDRSFWHDTTMPVGRCVSRTAESVTLTCCPPAPLERNVSMRRSFSSIVMSMSSGSSGQTCSDANDVCRRDAWSKGEMRTSRCTPASAASRPYAYSPLTVIVTLLIPASSPG